MHYFSYFTNKLFKAEQPLIIPVQPQINSNSNSNSFELVIADIMQERPSSDYIVLDVDNEQQEVEKEGIYHTYMSGYLLIGDNCEGRQLTLEQWYEIIESSDLLKQPKKDLYYSMLKGINYKVRKDVWQLLANTKEMKKLTDLTFEELCNPTLLPPGQLDIIKKDVVRTQSVTKHLKQLEKVLIAYVNLSKKGYTQGMNLIGGMLLRLLALQNEESLKTHSMIQQKLPERVFWILVGVMKWKKLEEVFEQDLSGLTRRLDILKKLMGENIPKVLQTIEKNQWDLGIFAQYYVTICLYNCPLEFSPMVLDLFLLDGEKVVHSLLIRMMVINQDKILAFKDEFLLMKYLKSQMLSDTYQKLLKNRKNATCLQDFEINFMKSTSF